jgi:hypothetical protein
MTNRTIYVAGASSEAQEVSYWIGELITHEYEIAYDWTKQVLAYSKEGKADYHLSRQDRAKFTNLDLLGIAKATVFWLLVPESQTKGAWVELGYAIAKREKGFPIIVISGDYRNCLFTSRGNFMFDNHDDAFDFIINL